MKLAYLLIPILLVAVCGAYTLPQTIMRGKLDMTDHVINSVATPVADTDAANKAYVLLVATSGGLPTIGGTMTGNIDMSGKWVWNLSAPVNNSDASTKLYVDTANTSMKAYVDANDTLLDIDISAIEADYLKAADGWTKINKSGDTMSGALAMGANKITGVANGTAAQDAVTYSQLMSQEAVIADVIDVQDYGAIGDGVTNDTAAIEAAITAAAGKTLYFPETDENVYLTCGNHYINANTTLLGESKSVVIQKENSIYHMFITNTTGVTISTLTLDGFCSNNVPEADRQSLIRVGLIASDTVLTNLIIERNAHLPLFIQGNFTEISYCEIIGTGNATELAGTFSSAIWADGEIAGNALMPDGDWYTNGLYIHDNKIHDWTLNAVFVDHVMNCRIENNELWGNHIQSSPTGGGQICIGGDTEEPYASYLIENNYIHDGGGSVSTGLEIGGQNHVIRCNTIMDHTNLGIVVQRPGKDWSANCVIAENIITNSGRVGNEVPGMLIENQNVTISHNRVFDSRTTKRQTYGITLSSGAYNSVCVGNILTGNKSGGISDSVSGDNVVANNIPL